MFCLLIERQFNFFNYRGYAESVCTDRKIFDKRQHVLSNKHDRGRQLALLAVSLTAARGRIERTTRSVLRDYSIE